MKEKKLSDKVRASDRKPLIGKHIGAIWPTIDPPNSAVSALRDFS